MVGYLKNQYSPQILDLAKKMAASTDAEKDKSINAFMVASSYLFLNKEQEDLSAEACDEAIGIALEQLNDPTNKPLYLVYALNPLISYAMTPGKKNAHILPAVTAMVTRADEGYEREKEKYHPNIYSKAGELLSDYGRSYDLTPQDAMDIGDFILERARPERFHEQGKRTPFNYYIEALANYKNKPEDVYAYFFGSQINKLNGWGQKIITMIEGYQAITMDIRQVKNLPDVGEHKEYYRTMNNLMSCISLSMSF